MQPFKTIGLIGRLGSPNAVETLKRLLRFLGTRELDVIVDERTATVLLNHGYPEASRSRLGELCDLVIVVGGDGSLLSAARVLCQTQTPVLGVNRGRLGFLTDISPDDVEERIGEVLDGHFESEQRFLLEAEVFRAGKQVGTASGLNDVVIHPGKAARMIEFELFIDGQFVYSQRSDGLIIATPTGSTASYSLQPADRRRCRQRGHDSHRRDQSGVSPRQLRWPDPGGVQTRRHHGRASQARTPDPDSPTRTQLLRDLSHQARLEQPVGRVT